MKRFLSALYKELEESLTVEGIIFIPGSDIAMEVLSDESERELFIPPWVALTHQKWEYIATALLAQLPAPPSFQEDSGEIALLSISGAFPDHGKSDWEKVEPLSSRLVRKSLESGLSLPFPIKFSSLESRSPESTRIAMSSLKKISLDRVDFAHFGLTKGSTEDREAVQVGKQIPITISGEKIRITFNGRIEAVKGDGSLTVRSLSTIFSDTRGRRTFDRVIFEDGRWNIADLE